MDESILVTGGTGKLGWVLVRRLLTAGYGVRVLSRRRGIADAPYRTVIGDLVCGTGLDEALDGVDTVVHCATTNGRRDVTAARALIAAAERAGRPHLVAVSIVGIDEIPLPYYRAKLEVERLMQGSRLPWTIQRATQFHELVAALFEWQRLLPATFVPADVRMQPIALSDVAGQLIELVDGGPAGAAPDLGGPRILGFDELACAYLHSTGRRRPVFRLPFPGRIMRAYRAGCHLTPQHADGTGTFDEFLAGRVR